MNKSVIVTGGAGYIGSVLSELLIKSGYKVLCLDNLMYGEIKPILCLWGIPKYSFLNCDITNYKYLDDILEQNKPYAIVHLAAIVGDPACKNRPKLAMKVNLRASIYLITKAIEREIPRFIFASTCSNYGKQEGFVNENSPLSPVSLYAKLKVKVENTILDTEKIDGFYPTILRFATAYGLSHRMRFDLTINEFTKELFNGRTLQVFGEQFWRPYCHVKDIARAVLLVLDSPKEKIAYKTFNVGCNKENYTKKMVVGKILKQIPNGKVQYVHKEEDPRDYRVNFDKIKHLGFHTTKTIGDGIEEIIDFLKTGKFSNTEDRRYYNS